MKNRGLLILLILLLLLSFGGNYYLYNEMNKGLGKLQAQNAELLAVQSEKDSLLLELENLREELDLIWEENKLGISKIIELEGLELKQRKTIAMLRRKLAEAGSVQDLIEIRKQLEVIVEEKRILENKNKTAQEKIKLLSSEKEELKTENDQLVAETSAKDSLLEKAQQPNYNTINIVPVRIKKGQVIAEKSAKKVDYLKINLSMFANPLTQKTFLVPIKLRITMPDGAVMSKIEKVLTDKSKIFTIQELVAFEGNEKKIKWEYQHHSDYTKGVYSYELFANNKLIQIGSFVLK